MPYYDYRNKPGRKDSPGPEDGYRPRNHGGKRPDERGERPGEQRTGARSNEPPRGKEGYGAPQQRDSFRRGPESRSQAPQRPDGGDSFRRGPENRSQAPQRPDRGESFRRGPESRSQAPQRPDRGDSFRRGPENRSQAPQRPDRGDGFQPEERRSYQRPPQPQRSPVRREAAPVPRQDALPVSEYEALPRENLLAGRNPIREALRAGRDLEKLLVARGDLTGSAREIVALAHEKHIPVQEVDRVRLDAITPSHQGLVAFASAYRYATVEEMLALAQEKGEAPFLILLDGVTDPHNLGAIIRSAECAGAHGVIVPERRAVGLTPAAVKASAGAVEHLKVARVGNLCRTVDELKEKGIWVSAACVSGEPYEKVDLSGPVALVIGSEDEGVSRLVREHCDRQISLPICGKIESLNASVAAGILMYEVLRRRRT